ncbi:MAG TPA: metal-dependent hydrolase [bacterium]|nr:metal-dependent hydrolase [bacterium]
MATLTYYGHSTWALETQGVAILIDPFLTGNPLTTVKATDLQANFIILTHAHGDHYGDTVEIAKRTGATLISNFEIVNYCQKQGVANAHPLHLGGGHTFPFGRVKLTVAHHGSSFPDGTYGGSPAGVVLELEGKHLYNAGDTALFSDMALIAEGGLDLAILPIGDNFTMGPEDGAAAAKFLRARTVIPEHYNTWPVIQQDPQAFKRRVEGATDSKVVVLKSGDTFKIA